jgi:stearoyl-CoA desaturase (delta-9 desaturase)
MQLVAGSERIYAHDGASPVEGTVRWAPVKSLWVGGMTLAAIVLGPVFFSWGALALFFGTSYRRSPSSGVVLANIAVFCSD